ncbi:MAG: hypothetical protein PVI30_22065 [Myxococcales bacterium]
MILLLVLAPLVVGCGAVSADEEVTALACTDGADNDGDQLHDCFDPDCQHLERCRGRGVGVVGISGAAGGAPTLGQPGAACSMQCSTGERCVLGLCVPEAFVIADVWELTAIEVEVPRSTSYEDGPCLDDECIVPVPAFPFEACGCPPDPAVMVYVDDSAAGATEPEVNADRMRWEVAIALRLAADSVIRFDVVDFDPAETQQIFSCTVPADPESLGSGTLECGQRFGSDDGPRTFTLRASVRPGDDAL